MIGLTAEAGFLVYVLVMLGGLGALAIRDAWRAHAHGWTLSEEHVVHCEQCPCTYLVHRGVKIIRCPRCDALHSRRRRWS